MLIFINEQHIISEENKALRYSNKIYKLPNELMEYFKNTLELYSNNDNIQRKEGYQRLKNLIERNGELTYEWLKRIKNYFDHANLSNGQKENDITYILNGGDQMKNWVNKTLYQAQKTIDNPKNIKMNTGVNNSYIKSHEKNNVIHYKK